MDRLIKKFFGFIFLNKLKATKVLLTHQDADCAFKLDGKYYAPHIGSIVFEVEKQNLDWFVINGPRSKISGNQHYHNASSYNYAFFIFHCFNFVSRKIKASSIADYFDSYFWEVLLLKLDPQIIIGIQPSPGLCIAAKKLAIPTYDYQHGVIFARHWWYSDKLSELPFNKRPDGYLCWDDDSANVINKWSLPDSPARVVGNLWMSGRAASAEFSSCIDESHVQIMNGKKNVLVSLQWGLHELYYNQREIWIMPQALVDIINADSECNWLLRLHPRQMIGSEKDNVLKAIQALFPNHANVHWEFCSNAPLPSILRYVDQHITDMSTVVTDAATMGIPSAIMNPEILPEGKLSGMYEYELEAGIACYVGHDKDKILSFLCDSKRIEIDNSKRLTNFSIKELL